MTDTQTTAKMELQAIYDQIRKDHAQFGRKEISVGGIVALMTASYNLGIKHSSEHAECCTGAIVDYGSEQISAHVDKSSITKLLLDSPDSVAIQNRETPESVWASIVDGLEKEEDRAKYPNSIFWFKNDENYFEYDEKSKIFWCRYSLVWSVFESKFNWERQQTQTFIEGKVAEHFKLRGVTATSSLLERI